MKVYKYARRQNPSSRLVMVQFNRHAILLNRMPGFKYYLNNTLKINICYGTWDSTTNKNFPRYLIHVLIQIRIYMSL